MRFVVVLGCAHVHFCAADPWWNHVAAWRTVSPSCFGLTLDSLLQMVDVYAAQGVKVFSINAAYDHGSDYNSADLWCGLAASDHSKVNAAIGDLSDIQTLADKVHSYGMKFVSWYNPSYFWTGSPWFQLAEEEVAQALVDGCDADDPYFYDCLPEDSFARWFKWCGSSCWGSVLKPDDAAPTNQAPPTNTWVWSETAGAAYFSYWAHQPTTDWANKEWRTAFANATEFMVDAMKIDGFVFDFPDGYQNVGNGQGDGTVWWQTRPEVMKSFVTDVVHEIGAKLGKDVAAFAELYSTDFETGYDYAFDYGFDGLISDFSNNYRAAVINKAVQELSSVPSDNLEYNLENAFDGNGGPDAYSVRCYFSADGSCPIAWNRRVVHSSFVQGDDVLSNQHNCMDESAVFAADAGVMPLDACFEKCQEDDRCDVITVQWQPETEADAHIHVRNDDGLWQVGCFLRGGVDFDKCENLYGFSTFSFDAIAAQRLSLAAMLGGGVAAAVEWGGNNEWWGHAPYPGSGGDEVTKKLYSTMESSAALDHSSLRLTLDNSGAHFAMLRYNAKHEGEAALVVLNMLNSKTHVDVDLSFIPTAHGQRPIELMSMTRARPLKATYGLEMDPRGFQILEFKLPAWDAHGFMNCYSDGHGCIDDARCPLQNAGQMLLSQCFLECLADTEFGCVTVSVEWLLNGWVNCYKRGPVNVDQCDTENFGTSYSTFSIRGALVV